MKIPDYLVIGVPKAGTSWLFELFQKHPNIFVVPGKETHFFDKHFSNGVEWYYSNFNSAVEGQIIGEICHDYIYSEEALLRIKEVLPDVKILIILRDSVDRSISHYNYSKRAGNIPSDCDIKKGVELNPLIVALSCYKKHLDTVESIFSQQQIGVFHYEDLKNDSKLFAKNITNFLAVDNVVAAIPLEAVNPAANSRNIAITRTVRYLIRTCSDNRIGTFLRRLKTTKLRRLFFSSPTNSSVSMPPAVIEWLGQKIQQTDN